MRAPIKPELAHLTCCDDEDRALCGKDLTNERWDDEGADPVCGPCDDVNGAHRASGYCLRCPLGTDIAATLALWAEEDLRSNS